MLGSGTISDPYQITTISELRDNISKVNVYLKLMNDLDFNEESINFNTINIRCAQLDGNGYGLYNIFAKDKNVFSNKYYSTMSGDVYSYLKNLIIEVVNYNGTLCNVESENKSVRLYLVFQNCDIRIKNYVISSNSIILSRFNKSDQQGYSHFNESIITIDLYNNNATFSVAYSKYMDSTNSNRNIRIYNCEIELNMKTLNNPLNIYGALFFGIFIENDAIHINIDKLISDTITVISVCCASNLYFITKYTDQSIDQSSNKIGIIAQNCNSTCFFNSDLSVIRDTSHTSYTNLYALTTSQCKDANYLSSIGFMIVE